MAKYVDTLQKNRKKTEGELEKELKDVMTLFRYLQDKDVFEEFYKNLLSKVRVKARLRKSLCEEGVERNKNGDVERNDILRNDTDLTTSRTHAHARTHT